MTERSSAGWTRPGDVDLCGLVRGLTLARGTPPRRPAARSAARRRATVTYIILRSGPAELGRWLEERRDVRADYPAIFGEEPPDPGAVTLSIDSNDTHSRAESFIGPIRFSSSWGW
jgi:hypothetical protein